MTLVIPPWLGIVMTVLLALITGITFINKTSNKADKAADDAKDLKLENRILEGKFDQFIKDFNGILGSIKITLAEQALLNNMSARTMDTLMNRSESMDKRLNDSNTMIRINHDEIERLKEFRNHA